LTKFEINEIVGHTRIMGAVNLMLKIYFSVEHISSKWWHKPEKGPNSTYVFYVL